MLAFVCLSCTHPTETEEETVADNAIPVTVATYNIKHLDSGVESVAAVIKSVNADIVGVQEVDMMNDRSPGQDQMKMLAETAGYPYYEFIPAIDTMNGQYGNGILSRYPIEAFDVHTFKVSGAENRALGHATVKISGTVVDVYCTHLSYESRDYRLKEMEYMAGEIATKSHYIITGDLNSFDISDIAYIKADYYVNRKDRFYGTFRMMQFGPDNIAVSRKFTETESGTSPMKASDHFLLYARFFMNP